MSAVPLPTRVLAGIVVPDTVLITKALEYARKYCTLQVYNHVVRSWLFGFAISPSLYPNIDQELFSVSLILHDLGWDPSGELVSTDKRFEVDSAIAARSFLRSHAPDWDARKLQLVWDTIALHSSASLALHKEDEVAGACMGILADITGPERSIGGVLSREVYEEVVKEFPLLGIKEGIKDIFCGICKTKPETTYDNFVGDFGEKFLQGYSRVGKTAVDFMMAP
ncbi:uncharacterized protein K444DRAFT_541711 [Hyaloscypha bicolor E]|uniref:HD domain-containing protein n=1 Tax=Hyaloscypha bicolor E TaxID=1095630 RepID=A0A2J6SRF5_9HELO|nr:uncharacterized protein K444DRAFT_541711 [Hyaloscypha bicolor E]PMD53347.1 hypothetical protein K444DRAFT_541711 [Hyaloscypha bicolor E]